MLQQDQTRKSTDTSASALMSGGRHQPFKMTLPGPNGTAVVDKHYRL